MRPTISQLRGWDPGQLTAAGEAAQSRATDLDTAMDAAERFFYASGQWFGKTRLAAQGKLIEERDHADEVRNVLQQIADESKDAGHDLAFARDHVLGEVDTAVHGGFTVSDTGHVTHPDEDEGEAAKTHEAKIQSGLTTIHTLDDTYGARLEGLKSDLADMVNGQPDVTGPDGGPMDADAAIGKLRAMTAEQRREYLSRLGPDDLRRLIQANPHVMGNTDGVPFEMRAVANEVNIRNAIIEEIQKGNDAKDDPRNSRINRLREMLKQQNDPASSTSIDGKNKDGTADDHMVERKFIAFQNTENGRFIEMIGGLDPGVRNATVYVPGTGSNLNGSHVNTNAAWNLAQQTKGPVFVYMDGDLPQKMGYEGLVDAGKGALLGAPLGLPGVVLGAAPGVMESLDESAADPHFAADMAPRLVDFGRELDTELAQHAPIAKTTFIGHSYGGSVVGSAEQLGLNADRVIYASSAGTGVFDQPWQNPNPHVERYSMTAPGDLIQYVQSLPGNPHGADPDSFPGVTRLDTGFYSGADSDHPAGTPVSGPDGHGDYWDDPRSGAFQNMVKVITGDEPTPYVGREPDRPTDPAVDIAGQVGSKVLRATPLYPIIDVLDGDIDLPGPLPDIPLRLPF